MSDDPNISAAETYRRSPSREILADPGEREKRGAVYAHFMDDFWKTTDQMLARKSKPETVGDVLDVVQHAFVAAAQKDNAELRKIGITPSLDFEDGSKGLQLDYQTLRNGKLHDNKSVQKQLDSGANIAVRFQKSPSNFVLDQVATGTREGTLMSDPIRNHSLTVDSEGNPTFDLTPARLE